MSIESTFGPTVHRYTRAEAIADGTLFDVSEPAREAGFRVAVALTAAAWADCVAWSDVDNARQVAQDEAGRLWDVVWMAHLAARRGGGSRICYSLYRVPRDGRGLQPRLTRLHMVIGPGDEGEPAITIMLPTET